MLLPDSLRSFVDLDLFTSIAGLALFELPLIDYIVDGLRTSCRVLPSFAFRIALAHRALHDPSLLPNRFVQSRKKGLIVAQLQHAHTLRRPRRKLLLVLAQIPLELQQLRFGFLNARFESREAPRKTTLGVVHQVLHRLQAFGAGHGLNPVMTVMR